MTKRLARSIVVVGGGNAALCAAMAAHDEGADVTVFERAAKAFRGGNTRHTRNIRTLHHVSDGYVTGPYLFDEFMADLVGVTGTDLNQELADLTIRESEDIAPWMMRHGAAWQKSLKGTLGLSRTNHFFLGGGKALLNSYYLTAEQAGVRVEYDAMVRRLVFDGPHCLGVEVRRDGHAEPTVIEADAVVVACGGFEANREWLAEFWGEAAQNFVVRGTPHNDGTILRQLLDGGARSVGDPRGVHAIAVDARAPAYDAGIITRLDVVPIGIVVNREGCRFADEGEDMWPKRYATWGTRVATQPGQIAFALYDSKVAGRTIPGLYRPYVDDTIEGLAAQLGLNPVTVSGTVASFNSACVPGRFDLNTLDESRTVGLTPPKSHWALPLDTPPYYGYPLRPAITFTYMGLAVDADARVQMVDGDGAFENVFAAGEIMSGNILTRGYLAGFGMTIGSVWGRVAGRSAARA